MHVDLEDCELTDHRTDICVIGAGVAGIALTRRLLAAGREVSLLESGGRDYESVTASLNAGHSIGQPYYALDHARLRMFGGTTAIWGGRVAELDPIDFEARPWVPDSGWPLRYDDLKPYYREAGRLFGLGEPGLHPQDLVAAGIGVPPLDGERLALKLWRFDESFGRFSFDACRDLREHPRCTVFTHATATELRANSAARSVDTLIARSLNGRTLSIRARVFVLAAGGIENPRLLLASRSVMPTGLGNAHDLVGRYFMEHPHARGGRVLTSRPWDLLRAFGMRHTLRGHRVAALIAANPAWQSRARMLNASLTLAPRPPADGRAFLGMRAYQAVKHRLEPTAGARALWMYTKRLVTQMQGTVDPLRPWLLHRLGRVEISLLVRAEQAPNPRSRVTLSDERDAAGVPRVRLDWRLSALDTHSVAQLVDALRVEFLQQGLGEVQPAAWLHAASASWQTDELISAHPIGGYHHMGTTRMAEHPRAGVTDAFGRVHGIDNLFIAGSSLFPTSGWANPTLTIVALSLRTADHIVRRQSVVHLPLRRAVSANVRERSMANG